MSLLLLKMINLNIYNFQQISDNKLYIVPVWRALKAAVRFSFVFCLFLLFIIIQPQHLTKSSVNSAFVHCLWTHKFHFSETFSLKMGLTILFIHLKIILLQYFQFQFSVSVTITINSIQTDPLYHIIK